MPAQRPCASFEPVPPDLDLAALVEETPNFEYVTRLSCDTIESQGLEAFEKLVLHHVINGGKPLVIEGFNKLLDQWTFTAQWLKDNCGQKFEQARNLTKGENMPLSISHYLNNLSKLTNQWTAQNFKEPNRQRIYLKDIDCPEAWLDKLKEKIPPAIFYLNESTGEMSKGFSAAAHAKANRKNRGIARAGDLMSCLPPAMRAENLMCYIGHEGTYTPAHREMCASLGQNIMVETSGIVDEEGKPSKPGSSIWFMTESKDRHLVSEYWLSTLGHDIEVEKHYAQINAWKAAPFTTYVVEQKIGDFILIPPLAPHQVWNRGTRTMKVAWNRTTVETLELALHEALPRARMVCRDEQYKNKAMVLFSLLRYSPLLKQADRLVQRSVDEAEKLEITYDAKVRQLQKDFKRLYALFTEILLSEQLAPVALSEKKGQYLPFDGSVICSYCRCNIFNRFLTCEACVVPLDNGEEDTYDICMECYAMGRSCRCQSRYRWVEQFPWKDLLEKHEHWRQQIIGFERGSGDSFPQPFAVEVRNLTKRSLAHICQEQLRARPFQDPKKPTVDEEPVSEEDEVNADGTLKKKRKKRRSEKWLSEHTVCHVCKDREPNWKMKVCACGTAWCYGSLWRGFDLLPQTVLEDYHWKCPKCRKICPCNQCRRDLDSRPHEPSGTVLGHDTKKIADPRSVEVLVDFSHSNMHWVRKAGDDHPSGTRRLDRRRLEAEQAKSQGATLNEHYVDGVPYGNDSSGSRTNGIPIDPRLGITYDHVLASDASEPATPTVAQNSRQDNGSPEQMRSAASQALQALNGLSRLEQDPAAFMQQASIDEVQQNSTGIAPTAFMAPTSTSRRNYEYPDPDAEGSPESVDIPNGYQQAPKTSDNKIILVSKKRKRPDANVTQTPGNDANRKFQELRIQKSLEEARKKNQFISAEAALEGKSLSVTFRLPPWQLSQFVDAATSRSQMVQVQQSIEATEPEVAPPPEVNPLLIESDLPKLAGQGGRRPAVKRHLAKEDVDTDFTTRKERRKFGVTQQAVQLPEPVEESSDDPAEEDEVDTRPIRDTRKDAASKRRSLPNYLAKRNAEDGDLPDELPEPPPRKVKPRTSDSGVSIGLGLERRSDGRFAAARTKPAGTSAGQKSKDSEQDGPRSVRFAFVNAPKETSPVDDQEPLDVSNGEVIPEPVMDVDVSEPGSGIRLPERGVNARIESPATEQADNNDHFTSPEPLGVKANVPTIASEAGRLPTNGQSSLNRQAKMMALESVSSSDNEAIPDFAAEAQARLAEEEDESDDSLFTSTKPKPKTKSPNQKSSKPQLTTKRPNKAPEYNSDSSSTSGSDDESQIGDSPIAPVPRLPIKPVKHALEEPIRRKRGRPRKSDAAVTTPVAKPASPPPVRAAESPRGLPEVRRSMFGSGRGGKFNVRAAAPRK
ncbi:hypothetical protein MMC25_002080 [Agyrium rufum]|nr:hypothetical protein [Agyrium rufum]